MVRGFQMAGKDPDILKKVNPNIIEYIKDLIEKNPKCEFLVHRTMWDSPYGEDGKDSYFNRIMEEGLFVGGDSDVEFTCTRCGRKLEDILYQISSSYGYRKRDAVVLLMVPMGGLEYLPGNSLPILYQTSKTLGIGYANSFVCPQYTIGVFKTADENGIETDLGRDNFITREELMQMHDLKTVEIPEELKKFNFNPLINNEEKIKFFGTDFEQIKQIYDKILESLDIEEKYKKKVKKCSNIFKEGVSYKELKENELLFYHSMEYFFYAPPELKKAFRDIGLEDIEKISLKLAKEVILNEYGRKVEWKDEYADGISYTKDELQGIYPEGLVSENGEPIEDCGKFALNELIRKNNEKIESKTLKGFFKSFTTRAKNRSKVFFDRILGRDEKGGQAKDD